jgi:flagellar biosynthetic protein FliS
MTAAHAYQRTQAESATPERILVLLIARARGCMQAADGDLEAGRMREGAVHIRKAFDIVAEFNSTLDARHAPELVANLSALYIFIMGRLILATRGDRVALQEAMRTFFPIADAFEQAASGRAPAPAAVRPVGT